MTRLFQLLLVSFHLCIIVLFAGCNGPELSILMKTARPSADSTYGYTPKNAIRIGYYDMSGSIGASRYYLHGLRTANGKQLEVISRWSIFDPVNEPSHPLFPRRGDLNISGGMLDCYRLVPVGTHDTISLFIDIYHSEKLQIPKDLIWQSQ